MAINLTQFSEFVVRPSLAAINLYTENAVLLVLGTAAQESNLGSYVSQKEMGFEGGLGVYQMQSQTFYSTWHDKITSNLVLRDTIKLFLGYDNRPAVQRLITDLALATIMCRLYYATFSEPLPNIHDVQGFARYWKKYYNTAAGKGTEQEFVDNFNKYINIA